MSSSKVTYSVVVPVYDEEANVRPLAHEIAAALDGRETYEIVFVDDGSRDGTAAALASLSREMPQLRAIAHRVNCGQSAALWTGVQMARGEWIVTLDGDGQNDPADIPLLIERMRTPGASPRPAMVAGVRTRRQDSWLRRVSSRLGNGVRARLLHDATPDTGCGLKLFRRETFLRLPAFDHMHRFLPALVQRDGGTVIHVDVNHRRRRSGRSKYGFGIGSRLWVGITDLAGVMWLQRRRLRPEQCDGTESAARPATETAGRTPTRRRDGVA